MYTDVDAHRACASGCATAEAETAVQGLFSTTIRTIESASMSGEPERGRA